MSNEKSDLQKGEANRMTTISNVAMLFLRAMPFLIISLLSASIHLGWQLRGRQFLMPIIALLFCIPCMLVTDYLAALFVQLLGKIAGFLAGIPLIGSFLSSFLWNMYNTLMTGAGVQLLCNSILMAAFCLLKLAVLPILKRRWTEQTDIYKKTSGHFYWNSGDKTILYQKYGDMRRMFHALYYTALALGVLDCMLVLQYNRNPVFRVPFYPVFGIILIGEICGFLDGRTVDENGSPDDPERLEKEAECEDILKALKDLFDDRLGYSDKKTPMMMPENRKQWEEILENGDSLSQVSASYFRALQQEFHEIDPDYVLATDRLMHRNSVLVYNPFYHDMTDYVLLPVFHELMNHHSCLVICGRTTSEADIYQWLTEGIQEVTNLPKLWKISELTASEDSAQPPDIGILGFGRMFDLPAIQASRKFFENTSLVIMLEPSNLLGTGQIGLRSILQLCEEGSLKPTYCILDRNADGLVDALSHVMRQSLLEVIASPAAKSGYCRAFWRAEGPGVQTRVFPNISHYMGIGGEISSYAMHEGGGQVHWYSGNKMPLLDLKWNIEQYYQVICQYIHVPIEQSELDRRLHFHESLWQAESGSRIFVIAEDEFCNAFEMERAFGTRIREKGFVNIMSESYMLRDYMHANPDLFSMDPKAIPSIVPDYARTERNFVLRTLLLMSVFPLGESMLSRELILHGLAGKQPYRELIDLIRKHTDIEKPLVQTVKESRQVGVTSFARLSYRVDQKVIDQVFHSAMRTAFYIVEDEQTETYMMGNRLMDHVEQVMLPGQFFSYEGKYYQVKSISAQNGIIVRRAADHITGRRYYRQLRSYTLEHLEQMEDTWNIRGIRIQKARGDIFVTTNAYLDMSIRNDLPDADYVELEETRFRKIHQKEMLKVELKDVSAEIRFGICVLMNELFQTIYPTECAYLAAVSPEIPLSAGKADDYQTCVRALVPACKSKEEDGSCIYILEDSNIDLGLLVSVERNFLRLIEIIADYLEWYLNPDRKRAGGGSTEGGDPKDGTADTGVSGNLKKHQDNDPQSAQPVMYEDNQLEYLNKDGNGDDIGGEDEELLGKGKRRNEKHKHFEYLTFGYGSEPEWLALHDLMAYLKENRFLESNLHRSRKKEDSFDDGSDYDPTIPGQHYCDFCGALLEPGKYEILKDGRERCTECGKDAIRTVRQFRSLYFETIREMQDIFGIQFPQKIRARMSNAKKVNEGMTDYKPTPGWDTRVLGHASGNAIVVENGAPRWKMKSTLVHELTHVWQHNNWPSDFNAKYKKDENATLIMEGMAVWTEVQYLLSMGEKDRSIRYKRGREHDSSVYGAGMKTFLQKYPVKERKRVPLRESPFGKFPPL